jgi:hypothetical protein
MICYTSRDRSKNLRILRTLVYSLGAMRLVLLLAIVFFCRIVSAQEGATPRKSTATLEQTLAWLKRNFAITFAYGYTTVDTTGDAPVATHNNSIVTRTAVRFEDCNVSWKDGDNLVRVSLADLAPTPEVRLHAETNTKFDSEVWQLAMFTKDRKKSVTLEPGGGQTTQSRSNVLLLYDNEDDAKKFGRVFQHAIELCTVSGPGAP